MTEGMNTYMPVMPAYGNGGGFGNGFGGDGWWLILLLLVCGNGMFGGFGGFGGGMWGMDGLYPWMNNSQNINNGFRDQMLNDNITSIRDGVYGITNQLCNGFAGTTAAITGAQNAITQQMYTNQIADMQQNFAAQTATMQGFNAVQGQLAQCCCDNKTAAMQNTRDIIDSQTRSTQAILDKLCALELDGVKGQLAAAQRENVGLQNQLNMAALRESQTAQNAFIAQGLSNEVDQLYNRLSNCPVPSVPVYGKQPIFTCGGQGCGCGMAG